MVKAGQRLWYKHKENNKVGYIIVEQVHGDCFSFILDGKRFCLSDSVIGTRLYRSLFDIPMTPTDKPEQWVAESEKKKRICSQKQNPPKRMQKVRQQTKQVASLLPEAPVELPPRREPSCEICALRKNGSCGSLKNQLCEDYRPTQYLSKTELDSFPKYGLATEIRMRGKK